MSFHPEQFRSLITRTLKSIDKYSPDAVELLMLTAAHESLLGHYLYQYGGGPALGVFQCEPATHLDHWRYLNIKRNSDPALYNIIIGALGTDAPDLLRLESDLVYQIVDCRLHYLMIPQPLPPLSDVIGMARYWDTHWNRNPEKGFPTQAVENYFKYAV